MAKSKKAAAPKNDPTRKVGRKTIEKNKKQKTRVTKGVLELSDIEPNLNHLRPVTIKKQNKKNKKKAAVGAKAKPVTVTTPPPKDNSSLRKKPLPAPSKAAQSKAGKKNKEQAIKEKAQVKQTRKSDRKIPKMKAPAEVEKKQPRGNAVKAAKTNKKKAKKEEKSGKEAKIEKLAQLKKKGQNQLKSGKEAKIEKLAQLKKKGQNQLKSGKEAKIEKLAHLKKKGQKQLNSEKEKISQAQIEHKAKKVNSSKPKLNIKKLEQILAAQPKTVPKKKENVKSQTLRERMMSKLRASRFRYLNETMYNSNSAESKKYFKEDPNAFAAYHDGYKQQVEMWPLNPLDKIIASIHKLPKDYVIADFGCGEAKLALSVPQKVHSFDLVSLNERVTACDMAHTPLLTNGVNVVVFCLSLMGTNLNDYLKEANRVLKKDGILKIAEVESRFDKVDDFIKLLNEYGFKMTWKDLSHNLFYFMDFKKQKDLTGRKKALPQLSLKPCLYKKR